MNKVQVFYAIVNFFSNLYALYVGSKKAAEN